ncbi:hypothetical protein [Aeromicrobium sp. 9AM]|uniref:hypothetical protein n=1 Tax=Aeromicrobium sp. 9AM TaxID=2653126 RepID=UPI001356EF2E|nr:hypothetical protein [Aeromicrobium sp. 9AM]
MHRCPRDECLDDHVLGPRWGRFVVSFENFADGVVVILLACVRMLRVVFECTVWSATVISAADFCLMLLGHGSVSDSLMLTVGQVQVPPLIYTIVIGTLTSLPRLVSWLRTKK